MDICHVLMFSARVYCTRLSLKFSESEKIVFTAKDPILLQHFTVRFQWRNHRVFSFTPGLYPLSSRYGQRFEIKRSEPDPLVSAIALTNKPRNPLVFCFLNYLKMIDNAVSMEMNWKNKMKNNKERTKKDSAKCLLSRTVTIHRADSVIPLSLQSVVGNSG